MNFGEYGHSLMFFWYTPPLVFVLTAARVGFYAYNASVFTLVCLAAVEISQKNVVHNYSGFDLVTWLLCLMLF